MEVFPINIAVGEAFCNRVKERNLLKKYIENGRHVVLLAPRRYGKTSLVNQVLLELNLPYCIVELTMATSISEVEQIILKEVGLLLDKISPKTSKAKKSLLKLFNWLRPEIVLAACGQKIIFHPDRVKSTTPENIAEILKKLDDVAKLIGKRIVVVMDEFQQLAEISDHTVEASIRHAMQYSKQVSYVFLGSNRHMLLTMFNSKNRPFYNSCELMRLERISKLDYESFIQKAAQKKWKCALSSSILEKIFELSEMHPSYINRICGYFWLLDEVPTEDRIEQYWADFVVSKRAEFIEDVLALSKNQRKVLRCIAANPTKKTSGFDFSTVLQLSEASTRQAVRKLTRQDYLYKNSMGLMDLVDPTLKYFINLRHLSWQERS